MYVCTSEPEVMERRLSRQVESPTKAPSSKEANFGSEITVSPLVSRRIPACNCTAGEDLSPENLSDSSWGFDELSSEFIKFLVEDSTKGFLLLLSTIIDTCTCRYLMCVV